MAGDGAGFESAGLDGPARDVVLVMIGTKRVTVRKFHERVSPV